MKLLPFFFLFSNDFLDDVCCACEVNLDQCTSFHIQDLDMHRVWSPSESFGVLLDHSSC